MSEPTTLSQLIGYLYTEQLLRDTPGKGILRFINQGFQGLLVADDHMSVPPCFKGTDT